MNKEQLLDYVRAVCDGESALAACIETEEVLHQQIDSLSEVFPKPSEPVYQCEMPSFSSKPMGCGAGVLTVILAIVIDFVLFMIFAFLNRAFENEDGSGGLPLVLVLLLLAGLIVGGPLLAKWFVQKMANEQRYSEYRDEYARTEQKAKAKYNEEMQAYHREMDRIAKKEHSNSLIKEELGEIIIENEKAQQRIKEELETLYARDIIKPPFRTRVAVSQIYEYLSVGVCDTLEGHDGAYAMYYNDIRANRICDSIQDLKKAMADSMKQVMANQYILYQAVSMVNKSVQQVGNSVSESISSLERHMDYVQNTISGAVDGIRDDLQNSADEASKQRMEIRRVLSAAAHNQYVEQHENGMSTWLLQNPD